MVCSSWELQIWSEHAIYGCFARSVREAGLCLLGEFYAQTGSHTLQILSHFNIRPPQQREIDDYFSGIDPIQDGVERTKGGHHPAMKRLQRT